MGLKDFIKQKLLFKEQGKKPGGNAGEDLACVFLRENGYKIKEKNFRTKYGEIDIIADDSNTICFIEVKSRSKTDYGLPEEFVGKHKQQRLIKTALTFISKNRIKDTELRFDIVSVDLSNSASRIIKDAFEADL